MRRSLLILILILVLLLLASGFLVRPYGNVKQGKECGFVIMEEYSGWCVGKLKSIDRTEILPKEGHPNCIITYSGKECEGIKLFERGLLAN